MHSPFQKSNTAKGREVMRKLALITPWPDERTGIADYAYDLALGIAKADIEVHVFTDSLDRPAVPTNICVQSLNKFPGSSDFDHVVYQMGNCSDFHAEMLPILFEYPGIVHLHDLTLHHLIAFFLYRDEVEDYYNVLKYWYGPEVMRTVRSHNELGKSGFWDTDKVTTVPFFDPVLQHAHGCIVHSNYALNTIKDRFPSLKTCSIPQVYRDMVPNSSRQRGKTIQVGVFGIVQLHKHVDVVMEAVADCIEQGLQIHLNIGGALDRGCEHLLEIANALGIQNAFTYHGRLSSDRFIDLMRQMDMCVSLRYPTMGETSAVVSRAIQLGLPTIVNHIGWYAELPDCVKKISTGREKMRSELFSCLAQCAGDPAAFQKWTSECRDLASNSYSFVNVVERYVHTLDLLSSMTERVRIAKSPIAFAA
jgi:glycosyltransferase involved in cell wall biosynthesis